METLTNCPICKAAQFKLFLSCKDYTVSHETFKILECVNCGFHFTNPRPTEEEIGKYYQSEEYISHSGTKKGAMNKIYHWVRNYTLLKKLQLAISVAERSRNCRNFATFNQGTKTSSLNKPEKSIILDYGCGTGEFLNTCKKAGMKTYGIEPEQKAREFATKNYELNIQPPDAIKAFPNEFFDVITLWHVLEHVHRLKEFLEDLRRISKSMAWAIIAVPNLTSLDAKFYKEFWAAYDVPRHLYHFSPKDIERLFNEFGFELENTKPMPFDAFYVSMLSEKYKKEEILKEKKSGNLISAFLKGAKSNIFASNSEKTYSSQIYIFRKT